MFDAKVNNGVNSIEWTWLMGVDTPKRTIILGYIVAGIVLFVLGIQWAFMFTQTESELWNHKQSGARLTSAECYLQLEKLGEVDFEQLFATRKWDLDCWTGIGVAPPEVDTPGIGACGGGLKDQHADFI